MDSKKNREFSPEESNQDQKKHKRKPSDDESLDTPTKQMIEEFLKFENQRSEEEIKKDDGPLRINRIYLVENKPKKEDGGGPSILEKMIMDEDQKIVERMISTELGSSTLTNITEDMLHNFNDGKRIYVNRLRFYEENAVEEHMLSFK